jgi:putative membrane protein
MAVGLQRGSGSANHDMCSNAGERRSLCQFAPRPLSKRPLMKGFILRWLCTTCAVAVATWITGIEYTELWQLFAVAFLLGLLNAFLRPILLLLSLPFIIVTLGFFILIVNTLLFWFVSNLVPGFEVSGFWQAFFAALIVSIVNWALSSVFQTEAGEFRLITHHQDGSMRQVSGRVIEDGRE